MPAKKGAKSVAKKATNKGAKKRGAKSRSVLGTAIIDHGATLSPYGQNVLRAFNDGVQQVYAKMDQSR